MVLTTPVEMHTTLSAKKVHMHPCMRAYATVQKLLCHGSYSELILSPVRASCRLSFAARSCHPSSYTFVHAWCSEHLSESIPHSSQKIHMHPCMRAHATVTKLLCYGNHSELILGFCTSILQVPPAQLQSRPNPSPDAVCSKSVKIHASS